MKISAHEEYGLRCLLQIAKQEAGKGLTIPEISEAEDISASYTAKLLGILRRTGLVKSARGKQGGYSLSRPANRIIVAEVLAALGGRVFESEFCKRHPGQGISCVHSTDCSVRSLWRRVQGAVDQVLNTTTLQDLVHSEQEMITLFTGSAIALPSGLIASGASKYREPLS
jgi:Rrf2 family protein